MGAPRHGEPLRLTRPRSQTYSICWGRSERQGHGVQERSHMRLCRLAVSGGLTVFRSAAYPGLAVSGALPASRNVPDMAYAGALGRRGERRTFPVEDRSRYVSMRARRGLAVSGALLASRMLRIQPARPGNPPPAQRKPSFSPGADPPRRAPPRRRRYHSAWQPGVKGGRWTSRGGPGRAGTTLAMGFESRCCVRGGRDSRGRTEAARCGGRAERCAGTWEPVGRTRAGSNRVLGGARTRASPLGGQTWPMTGRGSAARCWTSSSVVRS